MLRKVRYKTTGGTSVVKWMETSGNWGLVRTLRSASFIHIPTGVSAFVLKNTLGFEEENVHPEVFLEILGKSYLDDIYGSDDYGSLEPVSREDLDFIKRYLLTCLHTKGFKNGSEKA